MILLIIEASVDSEQTVYFDYNITSCIGLKTTRVLLRRQWRFSRWNYTWYYKQMKTISKWLDEFHKTQEIALGQSRAIQRQGIFLFNFYCSKFITIGFFWCYTFRNQLPWRIYSMQLTVDDPKSVLITCSRTSLRGRQVMGWNPPAGWCRA